MRILTTAVSLLFALAGCNEKPGTTSVVRSQADGVDLIHSRSVVRGGEGVFRCLASASGQCHYAVFAERACAGHAPCQARRLHAFVLAAGAERHLRGLPRAVRVCVDRAREPRGEDCLE